MSLQNAIMKNRKKQSSLRKQYNEYKESLLKVHNDNIGSDNNISVIVFSYRDWLKHIK